MSELLHIAVTVYCLRVCPSLQATGGSEQEETITVPSRHVGAVIGKGGEMINSMIQQSGCQIILQKVS